jgi:hypothetical protein
MVDRNDRVDYDECTLETKSCYEIGLRQRALSVRIFEIREENEQS